MDPPPIDWQALCRKAPTAENRLICEQDKMLRRDCLRMMLYANQGKIKLVHFSVSDGRNTRVCK